jgi:hypothetical protein
MQPTTETLVTAWTGIEKHPLNFRGDGPRAPEPILSSSTSRIGVIYRALVPVKNAFVGGEKIVQFQANLSATSNPVSGLILMAASRVIPINIESSALLVVIRPSLITNRFSPEPSARLPRISAATLRHTPREECILNGQDRIQILPARLRCGRIIDE